MDLFTIITILLSISFSLGEIGRYIFPIFGLPQIPINDIVIGLLFLIWVFTKRKEILTKDIFPFLLFPSIGFFPLLLYSKNLNISEFVFAFSYLLRWITYASLYFIVQELPADKKKKLPFYLLVSGAIIIAIGYLQYFFYPSLRNLYYLGWDEHLYRLFSVFLDPNFTGIYLVLLLLLSCGLSLQFWKRKKRNSSIGFIFFSLLVLGAIYLTYSRSALLMLVISGISFLFLIGKKKIIGLFLIICVLLVFLAPKSLQTEGTNIFRVASSESRIESAEKAFTIAKDYPISGVGFNAYRYVQKSYHFISEKDWETTHAGSGTDNSFLFVLVTTGIVGIFSYVYLWFILIRKIVVRYQQEKQSQRIITVVALSSIIGVFFSSFFVNSLFYSFIMEWLWVIIGLSVSSTEHT